MRMPGSARLHEISAVCTHPTHVGRGLGARLLAAQAARIHAAGEIPFLHVRSDNAGAIGLVVVSFAIGTHLITDRLEMALLASLATGAVMVGGTADTITNRLLSARGIVYLGTISYSVSRR